MTDRPIILSAPEVRVTLDGRKTQHRVVLKHGWAPENRIVSLPDGPNKGLRVVPYAVGDRLWVREALERANGEAVGYPADGTWLPNTQWHWKRAHLPSRFMPRWASRITLEVTGVRVERLQEISEDDAKAEGAPLSMIYERESPSHRAGFHDLWTSLHGPGAWEANPWVAVIEFKRIDEAKEGR